MISEEKYFRLVSDFSQSNLSNSIPSTMKHANDFKDISKTVPVTPKLNKDSSHPNLNSKKYEGKNQLKGLMKQFSKGQGVQLTLNNKN